MNTIRVLLLLTFGTLLWACDGEIIAPTGEQQIANDGAVASADARPNTSDAGNNNTPDAKTPVIDPDKHIACVQRINNFRATEGLPPLARWTEAESCSNEQSGLDANGGGAHGNFGMCGESGQNTCPNWGSTDSVLQGCLQQMWDEGPGEPFSEHGHYLNMSSTRFTKVACGFFDGPSGVWANQNFQ